MPTLRCQCHGRGAALSYKTEQRAQHRRHVKPNLPRGKNRIRRQRTPFRPWPAILLHFHLSTRWLKHKALRQAPVGAAAVNAERGGTGNHGRCRSAATGVAGRLPIPAPCEAVNPLWEQLRRPHMAASHAPCHHQPAQARPFSPVPHLPPPPACLSCYLRDKTKTRRRPQCPIPTSPSRTWVPSQGVASCEGPLARCRPSEPV